MLFMCYLRENFFIRVKLCNPWQKPLCNSVFTFVLFVVNVFHLSTPRYLREKYFLSLLT